MDLNAVISVRSDDIDRFQLESAIVDNRNYFIADFYDDNAQRDFQSIEWLMFTMMAIPVAESALNIALAIKNELTEKFNKHLKELGITKKTKVFIKISLPWLSYEREEEIVVEPQNKD